MSAEDIIEYVLDNITLAQVAACAVFLAGLVLFARRYRGEAHTRGSAHWMKLWQAAWIRFGVWKSGIGAFASADLMGNTGFLLGDWYGMPIKRFHVPCLLPVYYRGASNILSIGSPGAMKGAGVIIPNAIRHDFQVIYDLNGEVSAVCSKAWRKKGLKVVMVNPWGIRLEAPYSFSMDSLNPMDTIRYGSSTFSSDVDVIALELMGSPPKGDGIYWHNKGVSWHKGLIKHNKIHEKNPADQNLVTIRQYYRGGSTEEWGDLIYDMLNSPDRTVRATGQEVNDMKKNNPRGFGDIISTMEAATSWLDDESIRRSICSSTIRLRDLKGRDENGRKLNGFVFAIVVPEEYKESHATFIKLMFATVIRELVSEEKLLAKVFRPRVLLTVDEFPSLGNSRAIKQALPINRKHKFRIHLVAQSIAQLKEIYDDSGWKSIEGNCDVKQYLAAWDLDTARHVSETCGEQTIVEPTIDGRGQVIARQLIMPDEVRRMPQNQQIVFVNNWPPMKLRIRPYWERPEMVGRFNDNPFHGRTPGLPITTSVQSACGLLLRLLAGLLGPIGVLIATSLAVAYGGFL